MENHEDLPSSKRYCNDHRIAHFADHSQRACAPYQSRKRQLQTSEQSSYPVKQQEFYTEYPSLTSDNLHQLADTSPRKAIYELNCHFEEFEQLISINEFPHKKEVLLDFVKIFSRIINLKVDEKDKSKKPLDDIINVLLNQVASGGFFLSLQQFISCMPMFGESDERIKFFGILEDVISLFSALLERNPTQAARYLPIDVCVGTAQQLSLQNYYFKELDEMAQRLLKERNKICTSMYESKVKSPHSSKVSVVLPSPEELNPKSLLMKKKVNNIVDVPFPSIEEYLKVQRELLRDDFINPLRSALIECQEDSKAIRYTEVKFHPKETYTSSGAVAYKLSFKTSKKINWKSSIKTLIYGSLLCLSDDNFKTVLYATIEEREISELEKGLLTVQLQGHDGRSLPTSTEFKMIESPVYFKAYAPVIEKLHKIEPQHLCFSKYLVYLQKTMEKPVYLRNKREVVFNLKGVICNCNDEKECKHEQVHVLDHQSWSNSLHRATLDDSQKEALHRALTSELALIQGPPGTGKTYVGLKIIHTLLQNRHLWEYKAQGKCPIMVVCYTNHALDQFLEGVIDLRLPNTDIVRVGGRSKNDRVKRFTLKQRVKEYHYHHGYYCHNPKSLSNTHKTVEALDEFIHGELFVSSNCQIYASFLTPDIIDRFQQYCQIEFPYYEMPSSALDFAYWLDEDIAQRIDNYNPYQNEDFELEPLDEDRKAYYDDNESEAREVLRVVGMKGLEEFVQKLGGVLPLQDHQAERYFDAQNTDIQSTWPYGWNRLQLYKYCLMKLLEACRKQHKYNVDELSVYEMKSKEAKIKCLQQASVIGLTTTGATIHSDLLSEVQSKIVIVEEAAEVLEPQILATLTKHTQHLILIGDHKQLRPKTNDHIIGTQRKLEISMFERLVRNSLPLTTLFVQHRMRPEISQIVSDHFYQSSLLDHEMTKSHPSVMGMKHNVYFVSHTEYENSDPELNLKSYSNEHEAAFLACLCNYLIQQGYKPQQITIITPYVGQLLELRSRLKLTDTRIVTLDNYQGEENDIILLSLVRSNKANKIGFLKSENRICVALSRAKCGLYCIGNFNVLRKCPKTKLWSSIVSDLESKGLIGNELQLLCSQHKNETKVSKAEDFDKIPDGGCDQDCDQRLRKCNHCCQRKCHPDDLDHINQCTQHCSERCAADEHWCPLLCHEGCKECTIKVKKVIPECNHEQYIPCFMKPENWICQKPCIKKLSCGHSCKNTCGELCTTKCEELTPRKLICGHTIKVKCYLDDYQAALRCNHPCNAELACEHLCSGKCGDCRQGRLHIPCNQKCTRILFCGHPCSGRCAKNCPPCNKVCTYVCPHGKCGNICRSLCRPCTHRCKWMCLHQRCTKRCGEICNRKRCDKQCTKKLKCGHPCLGLCSEQCPPVCHKCDSVKDKVEVILGDEHDESAGYRYIKLNDCQHIFAVDALDQWMDQKDDSMHQIVQWKGCFICKKPVMTTLRYANIAKQVLHDLNEIKRKEVNFLTIQQKQQMIHELSKIPSDKLKDIGLNIPAFLSAQTEMASESDATLQKIYVSFLSASDVLQAHKNINQLLEQVRRSRTRIAAEKHLLLFLFQSSDFLCWIKTHQACDKLTNQMILDINTEHKRFLLLQKFLKLEHTMVVTAQVDKESEDLKEVQSACETMFAKLSEEDYQSKSELLKSVQGRQQIPLTMEERKMIVGAMGAKPGSWYKCPQGHYYNIGECGGAMEIGKCPECGSQIGGQQHRLIETNEHAGDFDGSSYAAWSERANLHNFDLHELN